MISKIFQVSPGISNNIVWFFYDQRVDEEFKTLQQAAYRETVREDDDIAERMYQGKKSLDIVGKDIGELVYHPILEQGVKHFHKWQQKI
jgi:choline monooxygenase